MKKRKKEIKEKKVEKENLQSNKEFKYDINCRCCRPLLSHSLFYLPSSLVKASPGPSREMMGRTNPPYF